MKLARVTIFFQSLVFVSSAELSAGRRDISGADSDSHEAAEDDPDTTLDGALNVPRSRAVDSEGNAEDDARDGQEVGDIREAAAAFDAGFEEDADGHEEDDDSEEDDVESDSAGDYDEAGSGASHASDDAALIESDDVDDDEGEEDGHDLLAEEDEGGSNADDIEDDLLGTADEAGEEDEDDAVGDADDSTVADEDTEDHTTGDEDEDAQALVEDARHHSDEDADDEALGDDDVDAGFSADEDALQDDDDPGADDTALAGDDESDEEDSTVDGDEDGLAFVDKDEQGDADDDGDISGAGSADDDDGDDDGAQEELQGLEDESGFVGDEDGDDDGGHSDGDEDGTGSPSTADNDDDADIGGVATGEDGDTSDTPDFDMNDPNLDLFDEDDDRDGRPVVSGARAPAREALLQALRDVDEDGDGRASASEMSKFAWEKMRNLVNTDSDLEDWDQDQDGTVNWDELDSGLGFSEDGVDGATLDREKSKFTAADTSGDGVLDSSELRNFMWPEDAPHVAKTELEHHMATLDVDHDHAVSQDEFMDNMPGGDDELMTQFVQLDSDADGYIDEDELQHIVGAKHATDLEFLQLCQKYDTNRDGGLSSDEVADNYDRMSHDETVILHFGEPVGDDEDDEDTDTDGSQDWMDDDLFSDDGDSEVDTEADDEEGFSAQGDGAGVGSEE